jgi:hypothetical protein
MISGGFEPYLLSQRWLCVVLWVLVYCGDNWLTLVGARLASRQTYLRWEGGYEMTPEYQEHVRQGRFLSRSFVWYTIVGLIWLVGLGMFLPDYGFGILLGMMLFVEVGVYGRHFTNILMYRKLASKRPGVVGHLTYSPEIAYLRSAEEMLGLAVLTGLAAVLSGSPVLCGGTIGFGRLALEHYQLARRTPKAPEPVTEPPPAPPDPP